MSNYILSVVIPAYNEQGNIENIYKAITVILKKNHIDYELLFIDDGSSDNTNSEIKSLSKKDNKVKLLGLSRNFGKEIATTAGISSSTGDAILMIDADGQHPPEIIPEFIQKWRLGSKVVVGVRASNTGEGFLKKYGSILFYWVFNNFSGVKIIPGSTDFRLIDKEVQQDFIKLKEQNRITRGLIDWLGFERAYISFSAKERTVGNAAYTPKKLFKLAATSFVSLSFTPLYVFGYLGIFITLISLISGVFIIVEQFLLSDPLGLKFTGSAALGILILFLVGLLLTSQGVMSLYISKIYAEVKDRPLYIVDRSKSIL
jgi:glycosyltransferase involved in cell wall biosynthesis